MSDLYVIAAIMKENNQYKLHKKHTSMEQCKSVRDILSLIGESDLCVHEVHANVGLMEGYANDRIAFSKNDKIDPVKPIGEIAYFLASEVVLTSDDVSIPNTVLKAKTWVVILDIFGNTGYEYQPLLDFGYSRASIDKWHATLTPGQLTLSVEERMELISNLALNTL
jgi:hypothetical protein